jgi:hypothetical protein
MPNPLRARSKVQRHVKKIVVPMSVVVVALPCLPRSHRILQWSAERVALPLTAAAPLAVCREEVVRKKANHLRKLLHKVCLNMTSQ